MALLSLSLPRPSLSFSASRSLVLSSSSLSHPLFQSVSPSFHPDRSSLIGFTLFLIGPKLTFASIYIFSFTLFSLSLSHSFLHSLLYSFRSLCFSSSFLLFPFLFVSFPPSLFYLPKQSLFLSAGAFPLYLRRKEKKNNCWQSK